MIISRDMKKQLQSSIIRSVEIALEEDIGNGDITAGLINENKNASASILCRESAVICGIPWVNEVFKQVDESIVLEWKVGEGDYLNPSQILCTLHGNARHILTAERTALNFLQTLSATATITNNHVALLEGTDCKILDTRKTIPGLRLAQKYAVKVGGGENHRLGLYDAILIKENHIRSAGSIKAAVEIAHALYGNSILIEVEVESLDELEQALSAGVTRIMLDNFEIEDLHQAVQKNSAAAKLEASGNIDVDTIREVALTGVDYISLGALTKHIQAIDLSLQFRFTDT